MVASAFALLLAMPCEAGGADTAERARELERWAGAAGWREIFLRSVRSREALERLIGSSRSRELAHLRYLIHHYEHVWPHWSAGHDVSALHGMNRVAVNSFTKLVRESILEAGTLGRLHRKLEREADAWADRNTPDGFDLEGKIDLGRKRYLGAEVGLPFDRRSRGGEGEGSLRVLARHGLDTDRHLLRLRWLTRRGEVVFDHRFGNGWEADEFRLEYRHEF